MALLIDSDMLIIKPVDRNLDDTATTIVEPHEALTVEDKDCCLLITCWQLKSPS